MNIKVEVINNNMRYYAKNLKLPKDPISPLISPNTRREKGGGTGVTKGMDSGCTWNTIKRNLE